jgi:hypothetical protein
MIYGLLMRAVKMLSSNGLINGQRLCPAKKNPNKCLKIIQSNLILFVPLHPSYCIIPKDHQPSGRARGLYHRNANC